MENFNIKYDKHELDVDSRFNQISDEFNKSGLDFVLVKGVVWNKGQLLDGADLDFYVIQNGAFVPFETISKDLQNLVNDNFPNVLISPRIDDFNSAERVRRFYVDAEMVLDETDALLKYANENSRLFFEEGIYDLPSDFKTSLFTIRFALNRLLEEGKVDRKLSKTSYDLLKNYAKSLDYNIYDEMLNSFTQSGDVYIPSKNIDYDSLVENHLKNNFAKEDVIFIKPLNAALKRRYK